MSLNESKSALAKRIGIIILAVLGVGAYVWLGLHTAETLSGWVFLLLMFFVFGYLLWFMVVVAVMFVVIGIGVLTGDLPVGGGGSSVLEDPGDG